MLKIENWTCSFRNENILDANETLLTNQAA